ncbi:MAG: glycosyltransferase family 1 protein [Desulfobulbaceae bacterium]|nr:MAG: glycosyltransferase family 1 protein [Desulfobulbaceae bacterium]
MNIRETKRTVLLVFYEPLMSGISRHIELILQSVDQKEFEFYIIVASSDEKLIKRFSELIPPHHLMAVKPNRFFSWQGMMRLRSFLNNNRVDIIHLHNLQTLVWGYGGLLSASAKVPILFTPHIDTRCGGWFEWLLRSLWRLCNPFTELLIALTDEQKKWFHRYGITARSGVKVINNHLDLNQLVTSQTSVDSRQSKHDLFRDGWLTITQIGRLDRQKNPFMIVSAAKRLREHLPKVQFLLIGDGPLQAQLTETIVRQGLEDHVILGGYRGDVGTIMKNSDIICLTSRWEGHPYVLLEAAALKKPIVASDIAGNRSIIEEGKSGFLFQNIEDFTSRLSQLIQSPDLRNQLGLCAYQQNEKLFHTEHMGLCYHDIYRGNYQARTHENEKELK